MNNTYNNIILFVKRHRTLAWCITALIIVIFVIAAGPFAKGKTSEVEKQEDYALHQAREGTYSQPAFSGESDRPDEVVPKLSKEEEEENAREIERMKRALPGNVFIPGKPNENELKALTLELKRGTELGNRVRSGGATREEKIEYFTMMCKRLGDRIDVLSYIKTRTAELALQNGRKYLSRDDIAQGDTAINDLIEQRKKYENEISELNR